jgi:demethylmenaquinone methyltransferase / 2-methoxy-6-polyprenyl-1,4-benzoquinol methylase
MTNLPAPAEKAAAVRGMFNRIAPRYDRMNRLITGNMDQRWRRALVSRLRIVKADVVLDLACGTGDFSEMALRRRATVIGLDFAGVMLMQAKQRVPGVALVQSDAQGLPLADECVDVVLSGFALRNFTDIQGAFGEVARVLRPGGRFGYLEVDEPRNPLVQRGHAFYFRHVMPVLGSLFSDGGAYRYLRDSTAYLPPEDELLGMLRGAGFVDIRKRSHMVGAVQAVTAVRA